MRPGKEALVRLDVEEEHEVMDISGPGDARIGGEDGGEGVEDKEGDVGRYLEGVGDGRGVNTIRGGDGSLEELALEGG